MGFTPPNEDQRRRAIGHTGEVFDLLRAALEPEDDFEPIPAPGVHDWLANHPEPGQTFEAFIHSDRSKPDGIRNKIYLQPLEAFPRGKSPLTCILYARILYVSSLSEEVAK